jgi:hypothetical protein
MGDAAAGDSLVRGFDYRLRPWEPTDRDEVIALIIGIQRGEFNLPITPSDQPDLADTARSTEPEAASSGSRFTAGQWWARSPL